MPVALVSDFEEIAFETAPQPENLVCLSWLGHEPASPPFP